MEARVIPTSNSTVTLLLAKSASAWMTNSSEGTKPHPLRRVVALEMMEAATKEEPKLRNNERAAVNNIPFAR